VSERADLSAPGPTPDDVRADACAWITAHWSPDLELIEWRRLLAASGVGPGAL